MTSKKGLFGNNNNLLRCIGWNGNTCLVGAADGKLQAWNGNNIGKTYALHQGGVDSVWVGPQYVVTGGADANIAILDKTSYATLLKFNLDSVCKNAISPKIRSACFASDQKTLLVGTYGSEIYEIVTKYIFSFKYS